MTDLPSLKFGRNPSDPVALKSAFQFEKFFDIDKLAAQIPAHFDREPVLPASKLGMAANAEYGCCVVSDREHAHLLAAASVGTVLEFDDETAVKDYAQVNGHKYPIVAGGPDDQGTDMLTMAKFARHTGIRDIHGKRHKDEAWFNVTPGDVKTLLVVAWLARSASIGVNFPGSAMQQFNEGKPFSVVKGATIDGGHCITGIGDEKTLELVTWGAYAGMTNQWYEKYCDELIAYVDLGAISKLTGKTADAIGLQEIETTFAALPAA